MCNDSRSTVSPTKNVQHDHALERTQDRWLLDELSELDSKAESEALGPPDLTFDGTPPSPAPQSTPIAASQAELSRTTLGWTRSVIVDGHGNPKCIRNSTRHSRSKPYFVVPESHALPHAHELLRLPLPSPSTTEACDESEPAPEWL